jgi:predicted site-specific integrase-resolvase
MGEKYYTALDVAKMYGVTDKTVREWLTAGRLKGEKINGAFIIFPEALKGFERPMNNRKNKKTDKNAAV